jgi:putative nucleotidyltransferase with HDIG domain
MSLEEKILQSVEQLPPFPMVIQRAIQMIDDPKASAQELVDVIQYDQSLTLDVLKLCNSAYFGLRREVKSLREALVMIGFNQLLEIILSRQSSKFFQEPCKGYDLQQGGLWRHSVACALLTKIISKRLNFEATPTHFTAGLLHDIGKVVLSNFVKDYSEEIKKLVKNQNLSFIEAEKQILGIDHSELGGKVADKWNFPNMIVSAIRYHHTPSLAPEYYEVGQLIYLCDLVALMRGIGGGTDGLTSRVYGEVMKQYDLKEKDIERFMIQLDDRFHLVEDVLKVN